MLFEAAAPYVMDMAKSTAQTGLEWLSDWWTGSPSGTTTGTGIDIKPGSTGYNNNTVQNPAIQQSRPTALILPGNNFASDSVMMNSKMHVNTIYEESKYSYNAICAEYINTFLQPEDYSSRRPLPRAIKTSITTASFTTNVSTNGNGDTGFYIFPRNIL